MNFIFNQRFWPGVGDVDDCWVLAPLQCLNAIAGWLGLVGNAQFRNAAGSPDDPSKPNPGSPALAFKAIKALYPQIGALCKLMSSGTFAELRALVDTGHPAYVSIDSGKLPTALRFGYSGGHAVSLQGGIDPIGQDALAAGEVYFANPLAKPHSKPLRVKWSAIKDSIVQHYSDGKVRALVFPTEAEAFKTHPLYQEPVSGDTIEAAKAQGAKDQKAKDIEAVTNA